MSPKTVVENWKKSSDRAAAQNPAGGFELTKSELEAARGGRTPITRDQNCQELSLWPYTRCGQGLCRW